MNLKLIEFDEQNMIIAKDQPEYLSLPAHLTNSEDGQIYFCWKMNLIERIKFLFTGKLWHSVLTFNGPLQPQMLSTTKPEMKLET